MLILFYREWISYCDIFCWARKLDLFDVDNLESKNCDLFRKWQTLDGAADKSPYLLGDFSIFSFKCNNAFWNWNWIFKILTWNSIILKVWYNSTEAKNIFTTTNGKFSFQICRLHIWFHKCLICAKVFPFQSNIWFAVFESPSYVSPCSTWNRLRYLKTFAGTGAIEIQ